MTLSDLRALAERCAEDPRGQDYYDHGTIARALLSALTVCEAAERQAEARDVLRRHVNVASTHVWTSRPRYQDSCVATEHAARAFRDAMARENEETRR